MRAPKLRDWTVRIGTIVVTGAVAAMPLLGSAVMAQADPPDWAPAHGRRGKDKKDKKDKHDKRDKHRGGHHRDGDDDRDDDWDDHDNDGDFRRVDFSGTVLSVQSRYRLTVRRDNGGTYTVNSRTQLSSTLNAGDRVRVIGSADDNFVRADRVTLIRNGGGVDQGQAVNFRGTVISVDRAGDILRVRGDNSRTYVIRYNNAESFDRGDRVRVVGTFQRGIVIATSIRRA